jgi:hypothetical protein
MHARTHMLVLGTFPMSDVNSTEVPPSLSETDNVYKYLLYNVHVTALTSQSTMPTLYSSYLVTSNRSYFSYNLNLVTVSSVLQLNDKDFYAVDLGRQTYTQL